MKISMKTKTSLNFIFILTNPFCKTVSARLSRTWVLAQAGKTFTCTRSPSKANQTAFIPCTMQPSFCFKSKIIILLTFLLWVGLSTFAVKIGGAQPATVNHQVPPGIPQSTKDEIISQIYDLRRQNEELIKGEQNAIEKIRIYGDFRLQNEYAKVGNMIGGLAAKAAIGGVPGFIAGSLKEIGVGTLDLVADKLPPSLRDKAKAASVAISLASLDPMGASLKSYEKLCDVMIDYYSSVHDVLIKQQHQNNLKIKELESKLTASEIKRAKASGIETDLINFPQFNYTPNQQNNFSLQDQLRFAFREYEIKMRDFYHSENKKFEERRRKVQEEYKKENIKLNEKLSKVGYGNIETEKIIFQHDLNYAKYCKEMNEINHEWRMFDDIYNLELDKKRKMFEQEIFKLQKKASN